MERYAVRSVSEHSLSTITHRLRTVDGGVEWSVTSELASRQLNAVKYVLARLLRPSRNRHVDREFKEDVRLLNLGLVKLRGE